MNPAHHIAYLRSVDLLPRQIVCLLLVGSQASGWATQDSDVDLLVVTRKPWRPKDSHMVSVPLDPAKIASSIAHYNAQRVETKYITTGQIDQIIDKVTWSAFDANTFAGSPLIQGEEELLGRLPSAVVCEGDEWHASITNRLAESAFAAVTASRWLGAADAKLEDVGGLLAAEQGMAAAMLAREAFNDVMNALLDSLGWHGSWNTKWRVRRVQAASLDLVSLDEYVSVMTFSGLDEAQASAWAERTARRCQAISAAVEL